MPASAGSCPWACWQPLRCPFLTCPLDTGAPPRPSPEPTARAPNSRGCPAGVCWPLPVVSCRQDRDSPSYKSPWFAHSIPDKGGSRRLSWRAGECRERPQPHPFAPCRGQAGMVGAVLRPRCYLCLLLRQTCPVSLGDPGPALHSAASQCPEVLSGQLGAGPTHG